MNFAHQNGDRIGQQALASLGLAGLLVGFLVSRTWEIESAPLLIFLYVCSVSLPMMVGSIWINQTYARETSGIDPRISSFSPSRAVLKLLGLFGTLIVLAFVYYLIPAYSSAFYKPVWICVKYGIIPFVPLSLFYIAWVDSKMRDPKDDLYAAGLFFSGQWKGLEWKRFGDHAKAWLVKGFFLPFMLAGTAEHVTLLTSEGINPSTFPYLYISIINLIYTIDILYGAVGYLLTLRILDSHIRSVDSTLSGWAVTLICYPPISALRNELHLAYTNKGDWQSWLFPHPVIFITWGFVIILLHILYVWSDFSFGCRFSNLTNRGIITTGPYRWFKHPAYLSKNIAWWLMFVPFVIQSNWKGSVFACLSLGVTNLIYFFRAKTEERHLLQDPAYQVYSRWMAQHGVAAQAIARARQMLAIILRINWIRE